jgi:TusA-related sulfurtransferase
MKRADAMKRERTLKTIESRQVPIGADPVTAQPIVPDRSIDCIALFCPMPIVKTKEAMRLMAVGQVLEMLSDDPSSEPDMKIWARRTGNELLETTKKGTVYRFLVRKVG